MVLYANDSSIKVTLESIISNGEKKYTVIYQGSASSELLGLIKKARPIMFLGSIEKAAIIEGRYIVEFFDGKEEKKYEVTNNYWIYDLNREKFLRCSILSNLRGYLINYLLIKGDN